MFAYRESIMAGIWAMTPPTREQWRARLRRRFWVCPGIAISLVARDHFNFTEAARFALLAVRKILSEGLPEGTLLNMNVPQGEIKGVKVTRQGIKNARPVITEHIDPRGKPYFWIGEQYFRSNAEDGTDYRAIEEGYVSITPLKSDMTDHGALTQIGSWNYLAASELLHDLELGTSKLVEFHIFTTKRSDRPNIAFRASAWLNVCAIITAFAIESVLEAMRSVPRHFFVTEAFRGRAYDDQRIADKFQSDDFAAFYRRAND